VLGVEGPSHEPIFTVSVEVGGEALAEGSGKSKKQAEQQAAKSAYEKLKERKNSQSRVGQPEPELA
jgi:ribonuclease-3